MKTLNKVRTVKQSRLKRKSRVFYINGKYVTESKAKIDISDLGITRGWAVFTTLRTYRGGFFMLDDHIRRLQKSSNLVGIDFPWKRKELEVIASTTFRLNRLDDGYMKIVVTAGLEGDGLNLESTNPSLLILVYPPRIFAPQIYQNGVDIITFQFGRYIPEAKTTNYLGSLLALREAKKHKAFDALFYDSNGLISECTTSNFFGVMQGKICTAKTNILKGITSKVVMNLAKEENLSVVESDLTINDIPNFEEAFITATLYEVIPVVRIDGRCVGKGEVGPITQTVMRKFRSFVNSQ